MARRRSFVRSLLCVGLCGFWNGCIAFYSHRSVEVSVHDAETNVPVAGAQVGVWYRYMMIANAPKPTSAVTDERGIAVVPATTFESQEWSASAAGYLAGSRGSDPDHPKRMEFRLYRQPAPRLTIIVPDGYRGPLKIDRRPIPHWVQDQVGKREFTFRSSHTGYVAIAATPLLWRRSFSDLLTEVRYESGQRVPVDDYKSPSRVALRWITCLGARDLYVVGTEQDAKALHPIIYHYINGDPRHITANLEAFDALFVEPPATTPSK